MKLGLKYLIVVAVCVISIWISSIFSIQKLPNILGHLNTLNNLVLNEEPNAVETITVNDKYDMIDIYNGIIMDDFTLNQENNLDSRIMPTNIAEIKDLISAILKDQISKNCEGAAWMNESGLNYSQLVNFGQYTAIEYFSSNTDYTGLHTINKYVIILETSDKIIDKDSYHAYIYWTSTKYLNAADTCIRFPVKEIYYSEVRR